MTTLTEFLLARIAEDEAVARAAVEHDWPRSIDDRDVDVSSGAPSNVAYFAQVEHVDRFTPARVLAECEAKRQIVAWASVKVARFTPSLDTPPRFAEVTFCAGRVYADPHRQVDITDEYHRWLDEHSGYAHSQVLQWLALPYADHPDYDESWRP